MSFCAPQLGKGTQPASINPDGEITGYFTDKNNVVHGFVRLADE
jgi:hypothetical protein